ncbi:retinal-specific phospholipid-transporting ATPase ABCA4-like [Amblyomma americanum]
MEGAGCCGQLGLVSWRQVWLVRVRRHYLRTLLELVCMLVVLSSVWEESVAPYRAHPNKEQFFDSADAIEFWGRPNESWSHGSIAFAPSEPFFADLIGTVCKKLGDQWKPVPLKDAASAAHFADVGLTGQPAAARVSVDRESPVPVHRRVAVWFERPSADSLTYHVRIPDAVFDLDGNYWRSLLVPGPTNTDRFDEMRLLLPLQFFIESTFINMTAVSMKKQFNTTVELIRFPYPRLFYGSEDRTLSNVVLRFGIGFFVPFCVLVVKLVQEKRVGTKEILRRAGLSDVSYWLGHFLETGFVISCAILLMFVPLFVLHNDHDMAFLEHVNPSLFMALLLLFGTLTILHAMLLSIFLWGPGVAFAAAVVYWFVLGLFPYGLLQNMFGLGYYLVPRTSKLVSALSPVMYLHWCFRVIERFEKYVL